MERKETEFGPIVLKTYFFLKSKNFYFSEKNQEKKNCSHEPIFEIK